jgi:uncharacterized membrane-anchored protein
MRKLLLWAGLVLILISVNGLILHKEYILRDGALVLLDMAPRDPRSLLQGDYMALRYRIALSIEAAALQQGERDGAVVITLSPDHVAQFVRIHRTDQPLTNGEMLLQYRIRGGRAQVATNAFYFQEGHADAYRAARFGQFRVSSGGEAVLIGLCNDKLKRFGAPGVEAAASSCLDGG